MEGNVVKGKDVWPEGCPRTCPGIFGEGCGALVRFFSVTGDAGSAGTSSGGDAHGGKRGYYACTASKCRYRWENVRTGRDCEFAVSFSAVSVTRFKLELISPTPTKVDSLMRETGLEGALRSASIHYVVEREGFQVSFDLKDYNSVMEKVARSNLKVHAKHLIPKSTLSGLRWAREKKWDSKVESIYGRMPRGLRDKLLPFQKEGVKFGISRGCRCLVADDMGVGKTIQAIAMSACYMDSWPLLIVVPASLRLSWANELEKWLPTVLQPSDIHVIFSSDDKLSLNYNQELPKVTIVSYKMLEILVEEISSCNWGIVIVDESHNIRSTMKKRDSKQTEAAQMVVRKTPKAILLTGTPSLSKPYDLFAQAEALSPGLLGKSKQEYSKNYCERTFVKTRSKATFMSVSGGRRLEELNVLLNNTIMIRRRKEDVLAELPPKRRQVLYINPIGKPAREDGNLEAGLDAEDVNYLTTGRMKCDPVCEWLRNALRNSAVDTKFLIFGHHIDVMDKIQTKVLEQDSSFDYVRIDGSTPSLLRQDYVKKFHTSLSCRCALLSLTAAGVGLDFSSAHIVVFAELPKQVSILEQAEARVHRKGLQFPVNVYFMCAKDTMDERLWLNLGTSLNKLKMVHDGRLAQAFSDTRAAPLSDGSAVPGMDVTRSTSKEVKDNGSASDVQADEETGSRPADAGVDHKGKGLGTGVVPFVEISKHTDRIHLHSSRDGTSPLRVNTSFEDIDTALGDSCVGFSAKVDIDGTTKLLKQFREEWNVLRAYDKFLVRGKVIELPLNLGSIASGSKCEDKKCMDRHLPVERIAAKLPVGAEYKEALIAGNESKGRESTKVQVAVSSTGEKLCSLCMKPSASAIGPTACREAGDVLYITSKRDLYCSSTCYDRASLSSSSSYVRRKLREIEKGVCQTCSLDCIKLVGALRAVKPKGKSALDLKEAVEERRKILYAYSETFSRRGFGALRERLLMQPIEGNAWQADHVVAVFQGGGCAGLDNMRTLCVCCHKEVTAEQAKLRARERRQRLGLDPNPPSTNRKANKRLKYQVVRRGSKRAKAKKHLSESEDTEEESQDHGPLHCEEEQEIHPTLRRRNRDKNRKGKYLSDSEDDSEDNSP
ncbi:SNF2-like DNA helicase [Chloropicon primus]|uniref:SNF2-like DNA helicase n=3 Tax=Chloropicon primus TaxID=1764295 RepID=A0A5B8MJL2_9CHLO|nr:SNF2-like DNA helicase [Chloropicon primus]UPQ99680.1 SNF2-like DNA helicase [Chloropicon primus]|eukprot:QDZ20471.1 SNF2-like DNA helicase [Chloropicon primus]